MSEKAGRIKAAILRALREFDEPAGASRIMEKLAERGIALQPRTIRLYLAQLDHDGLTRFVSRRRGRQLTPKGIEELGRTNVLEKVGFVSGKVDTLGYKMTFNMRDAQGTIITNVAMLDERVLSVALKEIWSVFEAGFSMGTKLAMARGGQRLGDIHVPEGMVGIGTVCSVTVNGILLKEGIPVTSRFGGLLEIRNREPVRFVELMEYSGTTIDPLEVYIRSGMTKTRDCVQTGSGIIGASFREIPSAALSQLTRVEKAMSIHGLGGILVTGLPNRPLLDIPVGEGRVGMVVIGGLNPIAAIHEAGIRVSLLSLAGLAEYQSFAGYRDACRRFS